jgi:hypothetical protein
VSQDHPDPKSVLLDVRIYRIQPGKATEFDQLVRKETVPLARSFGHLVVAFGPSVEASDVYYLIRSFPSREDRKVGLERLYTSAEWLDRYDKRVSELLVSYVTVVLAVASSVVTAWTGFIEG